MRHPFRKSARQGPVDPERLKGFEKQLGAKLPEPYRAFLLEHNGCDFGSKETPTTFFGLHGRKHTSIDGPTYPNRNFLPPEVLVIGHDYGDTPWLIGVAGPHRGEAFRARGGSDWESADEGGDVWENVSVVAPGLPALLDLITAEAALEEGDAKALDAYLAEGHGVDEPIFGRTPLDVALGSGQLDLARALLGRGADVSKVDDTLFRDIGATGSVEALLMFCVRCSMFCVRLSFALRPHSASRHARYKSFHPSRSFTTVSKYSCHTTRSWTGSLMTAPATPDARSAAFSEPSPK